MSEAEPEYAAVIGEDGQVVQVPVGAEDVPDEVSDAAFWGEYSARVAADTARRTPEEALIIDRLLNSPVPEGDMVVYEFADEVTEALDLHDRLNERLLQRLPFQALRPVDLTRVQGKTIEEVQATIAEQGQRLMEEHVMEWPVSECSKPHLEDLQFDGVDYDLEGDVPEEGVDYEMVSWLCWRAFKRGCAAGATVALGVGLTWAAGDRAWARWRAG